jgi:ubiquitin-like domain-containing CTD phosphatase 1
MEESNGVTMIAKWGKERVTLDQLDSETTIGTLKDLLSERTGVLPKRQKLIGLKAQSSKIHDGILLKDLKLKNGKKNGTSEGIVLEFIMMGTKEEHIFVDPNDKDGLPDVIDDFDLDFNAGSSEWLRHVANGENLKKFTESTAIHIMNEPRPGKPLLVLDLDHALLDFSSRTLQRDSTLQVGAGMAAAMKR